MTSKEATDYLALLRQEERALLRGDYACLGAIISAKEALCTLLENSKLQTDDMHQIAAALTRNHRLLQAARTGVEDARKSLKALSPHHSTRIYDRNGQRQVVCAQPSQLARKA